MDIECYEFHAIELFIRANTTHDYIAIRFSQFRTHFIGLIKLVYMRFLCSSEGRHSKDFLPTLVSCLITLFEHEQENEQRMSGCPLFVRMLVNYYHGEDTNLCCYGENSKR